VNKSGDGHEGHEELATKDTKITKITEGLARGARFNPTAFQAVSFQPPCRVNGGWSGRVSP
jgi:hypothetical protein